MKVFFSPKRAFLHVVRDDANDSRVKDESHFFYQVKLALMRKGFDVIKKEMAKDGHLTSEGRYYVRSRRGRPNDNFAVYYDHYQLRDVAEEYRKHGRVELNVEEPIFGA
jgi:hypothetical protein